MTPDDLASIRTPTDPRLSPGGDATMFVVSTMDMTADRYDRKIWVSDESGSRPFTAGPEDTAPRWSPDGTTLAFLRAADGAKPQVAVMPVAGGEPRVVSDFACGVEAIEWSPDGSSILVVAVTYADDWTELDDDERGRKPRRITAVPYRFDNKGWTHDRRRHLWLVDPDGRNPARCLTPGPFDEEYPAWSPDGSKIAFISDRQEQRGLVSGNDMVEIDVNSGEATWESPRGFWTFVAYRPDGALHALGNTNPAYPVDSYLYRRESDGGLECLTADIDRSSVSLSAGPALTRWAEKRAVIGLEDSGRFGILTVDEEGEVRQIVSGDLVVTGFDAAGGKTVFTATTATSPGELYLVTDAERQLTELNNQSPKLISPEHFRVDSDGNEIDVWVYLPEGNDRVPLLLNVHGGPASQYGYGFFDEFQVYAGAGYGVVACNPRGSSGRGETFVNAVKGDGWGVVDLADIRAAVQGALERYDRLDPERLGVMGGSYGGFMTAWITGQEDRWKSAVVERALISWTSFAGTSDIGGVFPENYTLASYPQAWDTWWRLGPLALAENVTTPTLVLHAEDDFRCPIEQAEQYFMALLRNGTSAELLRFPGEGHEMSRSGKPRHRKERFEAILDWHARHLK